ncbi:GNAT family N-acetyltransferase [Pedobacter sp. BMA]|uniref:GNAT family N-acetyltransferase n=1 Tax=Pedobacter sp. BMA TaxID=1663685 RepID=UPI00064A59F3|nr:GNAT family N-acetyltransferase [Pedobacter sp. BMA]KLT63864.1 GNAT family acetyltransferase [Pedobacter sp. BMA]
MDHVEIKKVTLNDIEALAQTGRQTFEETFSDTNSADNMAKYLEEGFSIAKLTEEVSNIASQFYFATLNRQVIGYLKLNTGNAQTEILEQGALEIERIYVLAAYHGQKVGQILYHKALQVAEELKAPFIWLGVWENNLRAIRFYEKNGFVAFGKHVFKLGNDEQTDIMMKKIL